METVVSPDNENLSPSWEADRIRHPSEDDVVDFPTQVLFSDTKEGVHGRLFVGASVAE